MSSISELQSSIQQYETQISQVDQAIEHARDDRERGTLEGLKLSLQELLLLTLEALKEKTDELVVENVASAPTDELALFYSELGQIDSLGGDKQDDEELKQLQEELTNLVGKKCSAPYSHAWGATTYHNALVCAADDVNETGAENVKVKVLFTNPMEKNMVPCPFYLDGECKFDADKCRFSHGEEVLYADLKEYKDPDFSLLSRNRCQVLVKRSDNLWYRGRVISANFNDKKCTIHVEQNKQEVSCDFVDVLPIVSEYATGSDTSPSDLDDSTDEDDRKAMHRAALIEKSLLSPTSNQALGDWEKHTKGFGSRMLQKFGYIPGTGLGQNGEGIVVPISAQILPPGRSLDHCMALREQANGDKDLFSVERKLKKMKKKRDAANARASERRQKSKDVFSFMNENVFNPSGAGTSKQKHVKPVEKKDFKEHTNRNLNVEKFKIGEDIRRKEEEIVRIQESLQRHKNGTVIFKQLNEQLRGKRSELEIMKKSEYNMTREQNLREDKKKMTIF